MKYFILSLSLLAVSCGNPHISSSRGGLERTDPPVIADPSCQESVSYFRFYIGNDTEFNAVKKCDTNVEEDFNGHQDGTVPSVSNQNDQDIDYDIHHQAERPYEPGKATTIDDVFGTNTYPIKIENPVTLDGITGRDRGINSTNATQNSKDALVWKFSAPISTWGAYIVGVKATSSRPVSLKVFDCNDVLIQEASVTMEHAFLGFSSYGSDICAVSITASDNAHAVAVDDFTYTR